MRDSTAEAYESLLAFASVEALGEEKPKLRRLPIDLANFGEGACQPLRARGIESRRESDDTEADVFLLERLKWISSYRFRR